MFGFVVLHMTSYAADIYFWRRYRINYAFIFGFKQGTELGYRGVGLAVLMLAGVLSSLDMEVNQRTQKYRTLTELVPLAILLVRMFASVISVLNLNRSLLRSNGKRTPERERERESIRLKHSTTK